MITRPLPGHWFSLALFYGLLTTGCISVPVAGGSPVAFKSYDFPDRLDPNRVIQAVELAFVQALETMPRITEGSVLSPLPVSPAPFTVEDRRVHLERLGVVTIHEVECPGNLAIMHAWVADRSEPQGLQRYTGCIQLYAGAYRVHLIGSPLIPKSSHDLSGPAETTPKSHPNLLPRLAQAFLEQVTEAREVTNSHPESFPADRPTHGKASIDTYSSAGERRSSLSALSEKSTGSSSALGRDQDVVTTAPLVCLAPRHETAAVKAEHGGGQVIQVFGQGSLMVVDESVDVAYFRLETTEGLVGWVNSSDVRRLPCPIG